MDVDDTVRNLGMDVDDAVGNWPNAEILN